MLIFARILLVAGFCVGTLGAAGFGKVREPEAIYLFATGLVLLFGGGFAFRKASTANVAGAGSPQGERARYLEQLTAIRDVVRKLNADVPSLSPMDVRDSIDVLSQGPLFDLTSEHEQIAALLGFQSYSRIWEGVACGERLLNRAWSMLTDGAIEEGLAEIPLATEHFDAAVAAFERA